MIDPLTDSGFVGDGLTIEGARFRLEKIYHDEPEGNYHVRLNDQLGRETGYIVIQKLDSGELAPDAWLCQNIFESCWIKDYHIMMKIPLSCLCSARFPKMREPICGYSRKYLVIWSWGTAYGVQEKKWWSWRVQPYAVQCVCGWRSRAFAGKFIFSQKDQVHSLADSTWQRRLAKGTTRAEVWLGTSIDNRAKDNANSLQQASNGGGQ